MSTEISFVLLLLVFNIVTHAMALQSFSGEYNSTQHKRRQTRSASMWDYFPLLAQNLHEADYEETPSVVERDVQHQQFRPLCQTMKRRVELRDDEFEYRPPHYIETVCKGHMYSTAELLTNNNNNLMCGYPGFACVQRSQTIYLTRRRFDSNCWESFTQTIASNCECMWPVVSLGEISHHY